MKAPPSFPRSGLRLLAELARNNSTAWFNANRDAYRDLVQEPMLRLVAYVNQRITPFAAPYRNERKHPLRRPNRDTRFSKDKSPYRTDASAVFPRNGAAKETVAGFYLGVSPKGAEIIGGAYMPGPAQLRLVRDHLVRRHKEFQRVARARALAARFGPLRGHQLKRIPRGYDPGHPAESLLRMTQWYVQRSLPVSAVTAGDFADEIVASFRAATPLVTTLDRALGNT